MYCDIIFSENKTKFLELMKTLSNRINFKYLFMYRNRKANSPDKNTINWPLAFFLLFRYVCSRTVDHNIIITQHNATLKQYFQLSYLFTIMNTEFHLRCFNRINCWSVRRTEITHNCDKFFPFRDFLFGSFCQIYICVCLF